MAYHGFKPAEQAIQIGDDEILSSHISDGVIVNADVNASAAIATSKVSGAVTSIGSHGLGSLATLSAVASAQITDGTIVNADVNNSAAIATSKLSGSLTSVGSHGLATSATTDTTNADNISSGTLAAARVATLNQNTTGTAATVTGATQSAITSVGTLTSFASTGIDDNADQTVLTLGSDESATFAGELRVNGGQASIYGAEDGDAVLELNSDEADDNADRWQVYVDSSDSNKFKFRKYSTGSWVDTFSIDTSQNATFGGGSNENTYGGVTINSGNPSLNIDADTSSGWSFVEYGNAGTTKYSVGLRGTDNKFYFGTTGLTTSTILTLDGSDQSATFSGEVDINPSLNKRIQITFPTDEYTNESRIAFSDLNAHISYKANPNFMDIWSYNSIYLKTGNSESNALTLDSSQNATFDGTVTKPAQPSFHAYRSTSVSYSVNNNVIFNAEKWDEGGCYDTSTGVFTAPVAGIYMFTCTVLVSGSSTGAEYDARLSGGGNNNTYYFAPGRIEYQNGTTWGDGYIALGTSQIVKMSATEEMSVTFSTFGQGSIYGDGNGMWTRFSGYLLG